MNLKNKVILFCRKIKNFNKNRYSRNRQNVKTVFFFSIYINILVIFLVFSVIYNFVFVLSYFWYIFFFFFFSFFFNINLK